MQICALNNRIIFRVLNQTNNTLKQIANIQGESNQFNGVQKIKLLDTLYCYLLFSTTYHIVHEHSLFSHVLCFRIYFTRLISFYPEIMFTRNCCVVLEEDKIWYHHSAIHSIHTTGLTSTIFIPSRRESLLYFIRKVINKRKEDKIFSFFYFCFAQTNQYMVHGINTRYKLTERVWKSCCFSSFISILEDGM